MMKIGITGGIGSGKTTVCEIFKLLGVAVFHADDEARNLQNNDSIIRDKIIRRFGSEVYSPNGLLDRKKLANIVFKDPEALADLNAIVHPAVHQLFLKWAEGHAQEPYVLYEAAVLLESGYVSDFDRNILVMADENVRIERVMQRDHTTRSLILQRIKNQMSDIQKLRLVDDVIENNGNKLLIPQVIELDRKLEADER